ncbi:hypothetical protein F4804DRAFT_266578 [Jackrogersella minutella]|nr:hypothetical protein F4804DRAFT_266578 [Jackrogersella minutella]
MPPAEPQSHSGSNWIPMYVFLGLIPIAFAAIAIDSIRRDRDLTRQTDIEMAPGHTFHRPRFPWGEAIAASERPGDPGPYVRPPAPVRAPAPVLPANFGRPVVMTSTNTRGDRGATLADVAQPRRPRARGDTRGQQPSGSRKNRLPDFEEVPL